MRLMTDLPCMEFGELFDGNLLKYVRVWGDQDGAIKFVIAAMKLLRCNDKEWCGGGDKTDADDDDDNTDTMMIMILCVA